MKVFVVVSLLATLVSAYPGNTGGGGSSFGGSFGGSSASFGGGGGGQSSYAAPPSSGGGGGGYPAAAAAPAPVYGAPAQAPVIHKHVYVHVPPPEPTFYAPKKAIAAPTPQKHYKIVFIKAPTPPPPTVPEIPAFPQDEQKTLIYVLVKKPEEQPDLVIPTPSPTKPSKPEVYFIRYKTQKQEGYAPSQPSSGYGAPASGPVASAPGDSYGAPAGPPSGQYGAPSSGGSGGPY